MIIHRGYSDDAGSQAPGRGMSTCVAPGLSNSRSNGYRGGLSANNPSILEMRGSKLRFADPSYRLPQFQVTFDGSELQAAALNLDP